MQSPTDLARSTVMGKSCVNWPVVMRAAISWASFSGMHFSRSSDTIDATWLMASASSILMYLLTGIPKRLTVSCLCIRVMTLVPRLRCPLFIGLELSPPVDIAEIFHLRKLVSENSLREYIYIIPPEIRGTAKKAMPVHR
jgi:hypothetical protein